MSDLDQPGGSPGQASASGSAPAAVASSAADGAKQVATEAGEQAKQVVGTAKEQLGSLVARTRGELRQQADSGSTKAAGQLRTLSDQVGALAEGRPESAGPLAGLLQEAQDQVGRLAGRIEEGGTQGVVDDVAGFARRRPGLFLAGAVGAGFVVGRLVRSGAAASQSDDGDDSSTAGRTGFSSASPESAVFAAPFEPALATTTPPANMSSSDPLSSQPSSGG